MRVGFATEDGKLEIGTDANSWGFGGTGKKSWKRKFENYGESFKEGDTIGCYLDFEEKAISFSKNGTTVVLHSLKELTHNSKLIKRIMLAGLKSYLLPHSLFVYGHIRTMNCF